MKTFFSFIINKRKNEMYTNNFKIKKYHTFTGKKKLGNNYGQILSPFFLFLHTIKRLKNRFKNFSYRLHKILFLE